MEDEDVNNFVGIFPLNYMNKFINHAAMISEKKGKYPFIIANTDSAGKSGIHWWSILDIEPKTDTFFASFGLDGLQHFIIEDDKKVTEKILFRTENKIMLVNIRFNLNACKNLSKRELDALSNTATNFFHFIQAFGNKFNL